MKRNLLLSVALSIAFLCLQAQTKVGKAHADPTKSICLSCYHFHPRWTDNYGDSIEKRYEEFEDVVKAGYFNSIIVEKEYVNDDEFWRIILENECTVWLNIYDSFYSSKSSFEAWVRPFSDALDVLRKNQERWDRFLGFHFDEPIWRGQSNADFLYETKALTEMYAKRIYPVFATGEFSGNEGNAMQLEMEAEGMRKAIPEALAYVTDIGFDAYCMDVRDEYNYGGQKSHLAKVEKEFPGVVDGKTYYSKQLEYLVRMVGHDVNVWLYPNAYTTLLWRGGRAGEEYCIAQLREMARIIKEYPHIGGLALYTYYQFGNPKELGLQSHLVVTDSKGNQKLRPQEEKWYDYSRALKLMCEEFKSKESNAIGSAR
ncbi:MAG: hypothetical protein Q4E55_07015 [Bacteroidales bacterium]|nr:hypothetical protein [Bacteroidales bacterium]